MFVQETLCGALSTIESPMLAHQRRSRKSASAGGLTGRLARWSPQPAVKVNNELHARHRLYKSSQVISNGVLLRAGVDSSHEEESQDEKYSVITPDVVASGSMDSQNVFQTGLTRKCQKAGIFKVNAGTQQVHERDGSVRSSRSIWTVSDVTTSKVFKRGSNHWHLVPKYHT